MIDESLAKTKESMEAAEIPGGIAAAVDAVTAFYESRLGHRVRRHLRAALRRAWPDVRGLRLLALGHATPFLKPFLSEARQVIAADFGRLKPFAWPRSDRSRTLRCASLRLPFPDRSMDLVLVMHGLENAAAPDAMLSEIRRVLTASGRLIIVAPNRLGPWASSEKTPFGYGQPYSSAQLRRCLRAGGFVVERLDRALWHPPFAGAPWLWAAPFLEKLGQKLWPAFGGVLIADARQQLYAPVMKGNAPATARAVFAKPALPKPALPRPTPEPGMRGHHPA